ncbi:MAG: efflux RND transporter periplasmic adaptor subunit [Steroidobacteraceae bacterium]
MPDRLASVLRLRSARPSLLLAAGLMLAACGRQAPQGPPPPPEVSVAVVPGRDITELAEYTGRLEAVNTVEIRPQVSGVLERVAFAEGREVKQGELLFQIDARPFQAELERAQAQQEQSRTAAELAAADQARGDRLLASRAISQEEYDQRVAANRNAAAAVRAADAAVRVARLNLGYTRITSPIDGRIGRAEVTPGNLVSGGQAGATRLTTLVSLEPMYAYFEVAEQDYLKYIELARNGGRPLSQDLQNPVRMAIGNDRDFAREGRLDFVDNRVQSGTGTVLGRAVFPNPDHVLTPGMFVRVQLAGSNTYKGALINERAIATDQDRRYVLLVGEGDKLEYRAIETGPAVGGLRVVRSGLKPGDRIVVNGLQRLRPGMTVVPRVVPMESDAAPPGVPAETAAG